MKDDAADEEEEDDDAASVEYESDEDALDDDAVAAELLLESEGAYASMTSTVETATTTSTAVAAVELDAVAAAAAAFILPLSAQLPPPLTARALFQCSSSCWCCACVGTCSRCEGRGKPPRCCVVSFSVDAEELDDVVDEADGAAAVAAPGHLLLPPVTTLGLLRGESHCG